MTYTRLNLRNSIWDSKTYPNISSRIDTNTLMNEGVRQVNSDADLRGTKRKYSTTPKLFDLVYDAVPKPTDMKQQKVIDLMPQIGRGKDDQWHQTTPEEFDRIKAGETLLLAVVDADGLGHIRVSINNDLAQLVIATLDSLTGDGGTWEAFGDAENVATDTDRFAHGTGSIKFDINAVGGTTAGIKNTALTEYDYSDYVAQNRSVFLFVFITSATNITNFKIRLGQEAAYDEMTATTQADGSAFRAGLNLLRFDFSAKTTTGSPDRTAGTYAAMYMTKAPGKVSETYYAFDYLVAQEGKYYDLFYYSGYGWQTSAGVYIADSTADTDYVNAENTDEYNLIVQQCRIGKAYGEKDYALADREQARYDRMLKSYLEGNPSEALPVVTSYYNV